MPPVSASKAKRQAEKAAKAAAKKGPIKDLEGSTVVGTDSAAASTIGDDDVGVGEMEKLKIATDRCVFPQEPIIGANSPFFIGALLVSLCRTSRVVTSKLTHTHFHSTAAF
jgi:hypothetical protein